MTHRKSLCAGILLSIVVAFSPHPSCAQISAFAATEGPDALPPLPGIPPPLPLASDVPKLPQLKTIPEIPPARQVSQLKAKEDDPGLLDKIKNIWGRFQAQPEQKQRTSEAAKPKPIPLSTTENLKTAQPPTILPPPPPMEPPVLDALNLSSETPLADPDIDPDLFEFDVKPKSKKPVALPKMQKPDAVAAVPAPVAPKSAVSFSAGSEEVTEPVLPNPVIKERPVEIAIPPLPKISPPPTPATAAPETAALADEGEFLPEIKLPAITLPVLPPVPSTPRPGVVTAVANTPPVPVKPDASATKPVEKSWFAQAKERALSLLDENLKSQSSGTKDREKNIASIPVPKFKPVFKETASTPAKVAAKPSALPPPTQEEAGTLLGDLRKKAEVLKENTLETASKNLPVLPALPSLSALPAMPSLQEDAAKKSPATESKEAEPSWLSSVKNIANDMDLKKLIAPEGKEVKAEKPSFPPLPKTEAVAIAKAPKKPVIPNVADPAPTSAPTPENPVPELTFESLNLPAPKEPKAAIASPASPTPAPSVAKIEIPKIPVPDFVNLPEPKATPPKIKEAEIALPKLPVLTPPPPPPPPAPLAANTEKGLPALSSLPAPAPSKSDTAEKIAPKGPEKPSLASKPQGAEPERIALPLLPKRPPKVDAPEQLPELLLAEERAAEDPFEFGPLNKEGKKTAARKTAEKTKDVQKQPATPFADIDEQDPAFTFWEGHNFKTQVLPEVINRKEYETRNEHLPKAVYRQDLERLLFVAIGRSDLNAIRALLDQGVDIEAKNAIGDTPLVHAAINGQAGAVRVLLARGANANNPNVHGLTAMQVAAERGREDIIDALFEMGAKATADYRNPLTPLKSGVGRGFASIYNAMQDGENPKIRQLEERNRALTTLAEAGPAPRVVVSQGMPGLSQQIIDDQRRKAPGEALSFDEIERRLAYQEYMRKTGDDPAANRLQQGSIPKLISPAGSASSPVPIPYPARAPQQAPQRPPAQPVVGLPPQPQYPQPNPQPYRPSVAPAGSTPVFAAPPPAPSVTAPPSPFAAPAYPIPTSGPPALNYHPQ